MLSVACISSSKAVTKEAHEHNDLLHADFVARMAALVHDPVMLMFADESSVDKQAAVHKRGWTFISVCCVQHACFVQGMQYLLLPILRFLTIDNLATFKIVKGSVTGEAFVQFLRELVGRGAAHSMAYEDKRQPI